MDSDAENLSGDSRLEFEEAKARIQLLLELNHSTPPRLMRLNASGHAGRKDGARTYSSCVVELNGLDERLV